MEIITHWHWLGFAITLIILEITLGANFFLLWVGVCAGVTALLFMVLPDIAWQYQLIVFAVGSILSTIVWYMYTKKYPAVTDHPKLNRRSEQYVGRLFTLSEPIINGRGKIRVDDSFWQVEGLDMPKGTQVKVVATNGVVLIVIEQ